MKYDFRGDLWSLFLKTTLIISKHYRNAIIKKAHIFNN